jgi:hypothetical protein
LLIICNVQGTWLVSSTLTLTNGPARSYPLTYHQVLRVDNLKCAGHIAGVLYPDSEKWTYKNLSFDLSPGSLCWIICNVQGTWLVCSNLMATVDLSMVTLNFITWVYF